MFCSGAAANTMGANSSYEAARDTLTAVLKDDRRASQKTHGGEEDPLREYRKRIRQHLRRVEKKTWQIQWLFVASSGLFGLFLGQWTPKAPIYRYTIGFASGVAAIAALVQADETSGNIKRAHEAYMRYAVKLGYIATRSEAAAPDTELNQ